MSTPNYPPSYPPTDGGFTEMPTPVPQEQLPNTGVNDFLPIIVSAVFVIILGLVVLNRTP